jgi:hypothetical protein
VGKDNDNSSRKRIVFYIRTAAISTEIPVRNPVLTNREWAWIAVSKEVKWCTGWAATVRK